MTLRGHVGYDKATDTLRFQQPVIEEDTKCSPFYVPNNMHLLSNRPIVAMLYVQKDLSAITKAVLDNWDTKKDELNHEYLYAANARVSPREIVACIKRGISAHFLPGNLTLRL